MSFQWYIWVIIIWIIWGIGAGIANRILEKLEIDEDEVFCNFFSMAYDCSYIWSIWNRRTADVFSKTSMETFIMIISGPCMRHYHEYCTHTFYMFKPGIGQQEIVCECTCHKSTPTSVPHVYLIREKID